MDEILKQLVNSELLSEEAKAQISEQLTNLTEQYRKEIREQVEMEVRAEINEQWQAECEALVTSVDNFVTKALTEELTELKSSIESFRDLEAEYAEKIVEEKHNLKATLDEQIDQLVDKIDAFFEVRLAEEMEELKEDIQVVKENEFGRKLYETFATEFSKSFVDQDSVHAQLSVTQDKLSDAKKIIEQLEETQAKALRESKMDKILSPLSGKKKEQMAFVLANVETTRLEEAYNIFINRILKEDAHQSAPVITEAVVVTGDAPVVVVPVQTQNSNTEKYAQLRKLAGIN
jgi:hypothetical protein